MNRTIVVAATIAATLVLSASPSLASEYESCTSAPRADWRTIDDVKVAAEALGFKDVRRAKVEGSCYEVYAFDKNGNRVEVYFDPMSLKVVKTEIDD